MGWVGHVACFTSQALLPPPKKKHGDESGYISRLVLQNFFVRGGKPNLASKGLQQEEIVLMDGGPARPAQDFGSVAVALRAGKHFYNSELGTKSHRK